MKKMTYVVSELTQDPRGILGLSGGRLCRTDVTGGMDVTLLDCSDATVSACRGSVATG